MKVRWRLRSADRRRTVECDWIGPCQEWVDGKLVAEHEFVARYARDRRSLILEVDIRFPDGVVESRRYVDELQLSDDGRTLWSYTVERDGNRFEGDARPRRSFDLVGRRIEDPPDGDRR